MKIIQNTLKIEGKILRCPKKIQHFFGGGGGGGEG